MDLAALFYLGVVAAIVLVRRERVAHAALFAGAHLGLGLAVGWLVRQHARRPGAAWRWLRYWYPLVLVPVVFKLNGILVPQVSPTDVDAALLRWDRMLFGDHPSVYLRGLESAWLTDVLRLCWMSYFVLPFVVAVPAWRAGRCGAGDPAPFAMAVFALTAGWYLSYLGYFVTPALGPGYYPEWLGAPPARTAGMTDAMLSTLWHLEGERIRDVCPSGHVIIAALCV
ncbi:MAG: phosphatase PAP2 family protein, partial [Planctomycetes bacterium]|nr:phosphatase PAP2 family protein [Planctomycetota bacterium]